MPTSQLSQLKAALTTAGLSRKSSSKKDRKAFKKGGVRETDRAKTLQRLQEIRIGLNKFDERETKVRRVFYPMCSAEGENFRSNMISVDGI